MSCRRSVCELRFRSSHLQFGTPSKQPRVSLPSRRQWISSEGKPRHETHRSLLGGSKATGDGRGDETAGSGRRRVTISGLVRSVRKQKRVAFAHIQDGTTYEPIQAILDPQLAANITNGAYVELSGRWERSQGKGQAYELQVEQVNSIGESNADENPIQKQSMATDYLRTIPHLRIRTPFQSILARVRSHLIHSSADFFDGLSPPAVQVQPPLITSSDCEGAGEVFTLQFFREPKYLTVSSQLHLEAWSAELGNVWALSPTFRAEESDTSRHLAEFYMLEAEFRGTGGLGSVTRIAEQLIRSLTLSLANHPTGAELLSLYADRKHRPSDSECPDLEDRWSRLTGDSFLQVSYTDAIRELSQAAASSTSTITPPSWQAGLALEHERWLVDNLGRGRPIIVTDYPKIQKPFYMLPSNLDTDHETEAETETVACFDILLPHGYAEVCGGSLREHRLPQLINAMREKKLLLSSSSPEEQAGSSSTPYPYLQPGESLGSLQWYADLRRFGTSPHGGFGLGFDRLLAYLSGAASVRDVVGFPRYWGRADC
ncbi:hypothetical protein DV738_g2307, partial [Chaetothyriales sp. CBS 135597]